MSQDTELSLEQRSTRVEKPHPFVTVEVRLGAQFYDGPRPNTHKEMAELLRRHATHHTGVLREVFTVLSGYHFRIVPDQEPLRASEGDNATITYDHCNSCTFAGGSPDQTCI
jgi:hypothetical protein